MKTLDDIFDVILLIIVIGLMVPIMFKCSGAALEMSNVGYETEDKTAKFYKGDSSADIKNDDAMTASEIILMLSMLEDCAGMRYSKLVLPNGTVVNFSESYSDKKASYINSAKNTLSANKKYSLSYSDTYGCLQILEVTE